MEDRYVAQLKAEFDSCDTTATGYLDKDELTELCHKLHLEAHLHLLLDTLLGDSMYARVNFEEFKDGFVAVLSRSLDLSTSDDESSYLEPVVPEEVQPKFVKGAKRYGRRTRPDALQDGDRTGNPEDAQKPPPSSSPPTAARRPLLPRSTSLESVESLKSEEDVQEGRGEGGGGGALEEEAESPMCNDLETSQHNTQELSGRSADPLYGEGLPGHAPISSSTPVRPPHLQRDTHNAVRSSSPCLLSVSAGPRVLSCLDDGSGSAAPDRVLALWTEEGVRNGRDILQMLDFSLEERLSLCDLSVALDNEMLSSRNTVHQAALVSYRYEITHLQVQVEQACRERDKVKVDLEQGNRGNLQLVREVDDRHAAMETLYHSRTRDLEQDFRDRLTALRSQSEQETEALHQQMEAERAELRKEVELLRVQESRLQEDLHTTTQEKEEEVCVLRERLEEAEKSVSRLQRELDLMLQDKLVSLDSQSAGLTHDEGETIRDLKTHCRDLQDRNDELSSELLRSQTCGRKRRSPDDPVWTRAPSALHPESDSDEFETKRGVSPLARRKLDQSEEVVVSIQTELAMEQLRDKHSQEIHSLRVELDTKVNFYERSLELMRTNMEVERKDISQSFKLEISELEEERSRAERLVLELKEKVEKMEQKGGAWSSEQERRSQREWAELDQNYAREINHLVQRLSAEKEEMGAELKLKMDQEVMLVREKAEETLSEVKLRHAEVQRQQSEFWEKRLLLMEQENQKEKLLVVEQVISLQEEVKTARYKQEESSELLGQSERRLEQREVELRCSEGWSSQLEVELKGSKERSSELEARLQEACSQLEENIHLLEAHEEEKQRLTLERSSLEEELGLRGSRDGELLREVSRLKEELDSQRAVLRAREESVSSLQETLRTSGQRQTQLSSELDSLRTDPKEQAVTVDLLQPDGRRSAQWILQEQLKEQRSQRALLQTSLEEEREEVERLSQEKSHYLSLADQLSTQIVEMEEEISSLRHHLRDLSVQLNQTANLVLDLRNQLRAKSTGLTRLQDRLAAGQARLERVEGSSAQLHREVERLTARLEEQGRELSSVRDRARRDSSARNASSARSVSARPREEPPRAEEASEAEKDRMKRRLLEMEELVVELEALMEPGGGPRRRQVEEGQAEVICLKERIASLQQDVLQAEDSLETKTRRLEEVEREHERRREEEERLHKENARYREEVLELSERNLRLSGENAQLSSRLRGDEGAARLLRERLEKVSKEQQEEAAKVRELEEKEVQKERERLHLLSSWKHERELLEQQLALAKDKVERVEVLEEDLVSLRLKQQWVEQDKTRLMEEAEHRTQQVEALQAEVCQVDGEVESLRSQLQASAQERSGHAHDVAGQHRKLQEAQHKVEELQARLQHQQEVQRVQEEQQEQTTRALQEEIQTLRLHNQDLLHRLSGVQTQEQEVRRLDQECQTLRSRHTQLESARTQAEDQVVRSDTSRVVLQAQVSQQLQEARQEVEESSRQQLHLLQVRLEEQTRRSQRLEEELRAQAQQAGSQLHTHQEQQQEVLAGVQERLQQAETKVKSLRLLLQEKTQQLEEQVGSSNQSSQLLQGLYLENSQLVRALQVTERRQKNAQKKNFLLEDKVSALNALIRDIVTMALAT